ncbi:class I glutamine amidotransferase-like protein [Stachybotrys elegans]|uniref:Class I glutamine amidotransferase-like protein n=1 Tax=Stachybotrys elegans TaxID=80388 RepID=A0A8K0SYS9_9HYPO|nr:class I glutamine amidotransferase-like protein [Stachybotrys elegans]
MAPLNVGIPLYNYQALDVVGPLDLLSSGTKESAALLNQFCPTNEEASANVQFTMHHIGLTREPVQLSAGLSMVPTCTVDDVPELDIMLLGGPDPSAVPDPRFVALIQAHVAAGKLLFTTCTGAAVAAAAGVLDGRRATVNHMCFEVVKKLFPKVEWTMETKWVEDGNIWTAGGAVAGMDMVAHWIKQRYEADVLKLALQTLDYEPRDVHGVLSVVPLRYDAAGKQIATHDFKFV